MRHVLLASAIVLAACGEPKKLDPKKPDLTRREKDSIVGASVLPGAQGVRGAIAESDSAKKRAAELDSIAKAP
jgi:hypothetical protein